MVWELPATIDAHEPPKVLTSEDEHLCPKLSTYGDGGPPPAAPAEAPADPDPVACPRCHTDACAGDCFTLGGKLYRAGDTLPDGGRVTFEDGIPIVVKPARSREPGEDDVDPVEAAVMSVLRPYVQ